MAHKFIATVFIENWERPGGPKTGVAIEYRRLAALWTRQSGHVASETRACVPLRSVAGRVLSPMCGMSMACDLGHVSDCCYGSLIGGASRMHAFATRARLAD